MSWTYGITSVALDYCTCILFLLNVAVVLSNEEEKRDAYGDTMASTTRITKLATKNGQDDAQYFLNTQRFISAFKGKMAILPCSVKNLGKRQVAWRRIETDEFLTIGKMVWSKDPRIVLEHNQYGGDITSWDILLRNVKDEDAGYYECQITSAEHLVWTLQLIVLETVVTSNLTSRGSLEITNSPFVTDTHKDNGETYLHQTEQYVTAGLPIRLACNTSLGNRTISRTKLEWYKDGVNLLSNEHILLTRYQFEVDRMYVSELFIDRADLADSGVYLCRIKDTDLLLTKLFVLPDSTIGGAKREDRSQYSGVGTLQQENHSTNNAVCTKGLLLVWLLFFTIVQTVLVQEASLHHTGDIVIASEKQRIFIRWS